MAWPVSITATLRPLSEDTRDLQIHRIIKDQLRGRLTEEKIAHYREILPGVCKQASDTERRADEAERETDKLKKAEYMEEHIGESYRA